MNKMISSFQSKSPTRNENTSPSNLYSTKIPQQVRLPSHRTDPFVDIQTSHILANDLNNPWISSLETILYNQPELHSTLTANKYGVVMNCGDSNGIDFGTVEIGTRRSFQGNIQVKDGSQLTSIFLLPFEYKSFTVTINQTHSIGSTDQSNLHYLDLNSNLKHHTIEISMNEDLELGYRKQWVFFVFENRFMGSSFFDLHKTTFLIARKMVAKVSRLDDLQLLNVNAKPYVPLAYRQHFHKPSPIVFLQDDASQIYKMQLQQTQHGLDDYHLSSHENIVDDDFSTKKMDLNEENYGKTYTMLLQLEERQTAKEIEMFDLFNVGLKPRKVNDIFLAMIHVPGACEDRPPLSYGDIVKLRPAVFHQKTFEIHATVVDKIEDKVKIQLPHILQTKFCLGYSMFFPEYFNIVGPYSFSCPSKSRSSEPFKCGHITLCIECTRTMIKLVCDRIMLDAYCPICHCSLKTFSTNSLLNMTEMIYSQQYFHVRFTYQRIGFRLMYRAIQHINDHCKQLLFPSIDLQNLQIDKEKITKITDILLYNQNINDRQLQAILNGLNSHQPNVPRIIFGPPGTGKTMTLIELIRQILHHFPKAKILVTAPSDAAADILGLRLAPFLNPKEMIRLNWYQRLIASVPGGLLQYCFVQKDSDVFTLPPSDTLLAARVVISTCIFSGILTSLSIPLGHFTHVIIDEASQALEPEVCVVLSTCGPKTQVSVAGDPKQLGAVLRSYKASIRGLSTSYQERLMNLPLYSTKNSDYITKLVKNYRSHNTILNLPSKLFYDNELLACGDPRLVDSMCSWEELPKEEQFPLLFYGILSEHFSDLDSPSLYNPTEAIKIADTIHDLLTSTQVSVTTQDIAVITPFRKQVLKIRQLLRNRGYNGVNVGTVNNFQGNESKIVLISTVVASLSNSAANSIALLGDPKRFNVAVTRSKALSIIVGHPGVLSEDQYWHSILEYCIQHNAYRGCNCSLLRKYRYPFKDEDYKEELLESMVKMHILGAGNMKQEFPTDLNDFYRDDSEWRVVL